MCALGKAHPTIKKEKYKGNTAQFMAHALLAYYSVRLPKNQYPYVSMHNILTKNLTTQSAHQNYAVLPKYNREQRCF